jgi:hypothetical protein
MSVPGVPSDCTRFLRSDVCLFSRPSVLISKIVVKAFSQHSPGNSTLQVTSHCASRFPMTMETASGHDRNPVALAFAVAALQRGETPEHVFSPSLQESFPDNITASFVLSSQQAGSGSQEEANAGAVGLTLDSPREEVTEQRLAKSRERNREHARATRIRKVRNILCRVNCLLMILSPFLCFSSSKKRRRAKWKPYSPKSRVSKPNVKR